jgi:chitinase
MNYVHVQIAWASAQWWRILLRISVNGVIRWSLGWDAGRTRIR